MSESPVDSIARKRLEEAQSTDAQLTNQSLVTAEIENGSPLKPTPPPRSEKREYKLAVSEIASRIVGDVLEQALRTPR